jgi:hypothetical protein
MKKKKELREKQREEKLKMQMEERQLNLRKKDEAQHL